VSNTVANRLKMLRLKTGWAQHAVATYLGVEQSTISRWEAGQTEPVGLYLQSLNRLFRAKRIKA
jgi:transcriptional regulator with XRE-family HTH domain